MTQILKPMMLRRLKEDVEKGIAPKEETIIEVHMSEYVMYYIQSTNAKEKCI